MTDASAGAWFSCCRTTPVAVVAVSAVTVIATAYITFVLFVRLIRTVVVAVGSPLPKNQALQSPASVAVSTARPPDTAGTSVLAPAGSIFTLNALSALALTKVKTKRPLEEAVNGTLISNEASLVEPVVPVCDSVALSWATAISVNSPYYHSLALQNSRNLQRLKLITS